MAIIRTCLRARAAGRRFLPHHLLLHPQVHPQLRPRRRLTRQQVTRHLLPLHRYDEDHMYRIPHLVGSSGSTHGCADKAAAAVS